MTSGNQEKVPMPLLVQGAEPRTGDPSLPGGYCPIREVWMVGALPIVQGVTRLTELETKTDTLRERDDPGASAALEMLTKTKHEIERDDDDFSLHALELITKTSTKVERDD